MHSLPGNARDRPKVRKNSSSRPAPRDDHGCTPGAAMPRDHSKRYDFFLSRRGSLAAIAREVNDVLSEAGYSVIVEDYDFRPGASFVEAMHEGIKNSRDLLILHTADYETSFYTRKEFTSFIAEQSHSPEQRHLIVLRCEDVPPRGLLA